MQADMYNKQTENTMSMTMYTNTCMKNNPMYVNSD